MDGHVLLHHLRLKDLNFLNSLSSCGCEHSAVIVLLTSICLFVLLRFLRDMRLVV